MHGKRQYELADLSQFGLVPDQDLRGIEQLVSTQQAEELAIEQSAWTDQIPQWLELAVGLGGTVGASRAAGVAVDRARQMVSAGASRAAASARTLLPWPSEFWGSEPSPSCSRAVTTPQSTSPSSRRQRPKP
jgi:hypothetical protein